MDALAPHTIVEIAGTRIDSWTDEGLFAEVGVELTTDKSGEGCIGLYDPDFKLVDGFLPGNKPAAKIWLGWGNEILSPIFTGVLMRAEHAGGISTFRFHDNSAKMKREKKTRYHKKKTDVQILKTLAEDNELKFQLKAAQIIEGEELDVVMQAGVTDWEYAKEIADEAGLKLYVDGDTLVAVEAGTTVINNPSAILEYKKDFELLRGFNLSYKLPENKKGRSHKTEYRGRGKGGKRLKGEKTVGDTGKKEVIVKKDLKKHSVGRATRQASGKSGLKREYAFEHQLTMLPSFQKRVNLRDTITLSNMGGFFSGNYIITDLRYQFRPGRLTCELTVGRDLK